MIRLHIETVDRIKYASFQFNYFSNDSSFIRCENGERLRLHPDFNPHTFGHCVIFFGQESYRSPPPPKSEGAVRLWEYSFLQDVWHSCRSIHPFFLQRRPCLSLESGPAIKPAAILVILDVAILCAVGQGYHLKGCGNRNVYALWTGCLVWNVSRLLPLLQAVYPSQNLSGSLDHDGLTYH